MSARAHLHVITGAQQRKWHLPTFRCKLRRNDGATLDYIGPFGDWSSEWHLVLRRARK